MGGVFRLAPPVTISAIQIELGLQILDKSFGHVLKGHGLHVNRAKVLRARQRCYIETRRLATYC